MTWLAARRATVLIPSGPDHDPDRMHLHIVLTDPRADKNGMEKVIVVSVSSVPSTQIYDSSCTLFTGEHPFISRDSFVTYQFAAVVDPNLLEQEVAQKRFVAKSIMDEKVFRFVIEGLRESPYTTPRILRLFDEWCDTADQQQA